MNDYVDYLNALQASSNVSQVGDEQQQEYVQGIQQKMMDKMLPTEELSQIPGLASGGISGVLGMAKSVGQSFIKDAMTTQMKNLGIDDNTIASVLKGDLSEAMQSKVGDLVSNVKGLAQDGIATAKNVLQDTLNTATNTVDNVVDSAKQALSNGIDTIQNTVSDLTDTATSIANNVEGISSDLASQAQQEFQSTTGISLSDTEQGSSNIFTNILNRFSPQVNESQSIEMVDFAAPDEVANLAPEISDTLTGALSSIQNGITGVAGLIGDATSSLTSSLPSALSVLPSLTSSLSGAAGEATSALATGAEVAGEAVGDTIMGAIGVASSVLGPLGLFAGIIGGIVGGIEMHKDEERAADVIAPPQPILNPSAQFL